MVTIGQFYKDKDKRRKGERFLKVIAVNYSEASKAKGGGFAHLVWVDGYGKQIASHKETRINTKNLERRFTLIPASCMDDLSSQTPVAVYGDANDI